MLERAGRPSAHGYSREWSIYLSICVPDSVISKLCFCVMVMLCMRCFVVPVGIHEGSVLGE